MGDFVKNFIKGGHRRGIKRISPVTLEEMYEVFEEQRSLLLKKGTRSRQFHGGILQYF